MKILIIADTMAIGGTEKLTIALVDEFVKKDHVCKIMVLRDDLDSLKYLKSEQVPIEHIYKKYRFDFFYARKVRKVINLYKPDIILCQAFFSYCSARLAIVFHKQIPIFVALHYTYNSNLKDALFDRLYFLMLRFNKDCIISIYRLQADFFSKKYHIPIERFVLIHNGIDIEVFQDRQRLGEVRDCLHVVHIANIKEEKDQLTLLNAMNLLEDKNVNWQLTFCGRDHAKRKQLFINYLRKNKIEHKVNFIDFVEDVRIILENADVFVLSSISEALPVSALEAMAMNVPCILTDVGGCSDIVDDGLNGFLVPPENAAAIAEKLAFIALHRDILIGMGKAARKKVESQFGIERMAQEYLGLFKGDAR
jgi:glycosyltransferase involved in cell wall biosynthesis